MLIYFVSISPHALLICKDSQNSSTIDSNELHSITIGSSFQSEIDNNDEIELVLNSIPAVS